MSSEILSVLEYMEKEKGIPRTDMIATITNALKTAAQKGVSSGQELKIEINPKNGQLHAWAVLKVVDSVSNPRTEIHVEKAQALKPGALLGEICRKGDRSLLPRPDRGANRPPGGDAAAAAVRKGPHLRRFQGPGGQYCHGHGPPARAQRHLRRSGQGRGGHAGQGADAGRGIPARATASARLLLEIENTPRGPEIILSRASAKFVRRLFELEVTEIADGTVKIEAFAREPGYRTKIAVTSSDPKVDPVGACVGARGARVKTIVRELAGEKIDIIKYFADPREMVIEALKPAVPRDIILDDKKHRIS